MIKGSRRELIVLRTGESRYFDEAYFVLRREIEVGARCRTDILREANRILEENVPKPSGRQRGRLGSALWFVVGVISGAAFALAFVFFV